MQDDILDSLAHLNFRVLGEFDEEYSTYAAYCLETGTIATADDPDSLVDAIKEALTAEIVLALRAGQIERLFQRPAAKEVWLRWLRAVGQSGEPERIDLDIGARLDASVPRRGPQSAISLVGVSAQHARLA
jgi:hypothetical protein